MAEEGNQESNKATIYINNVEFKVDPKMTILEACRSNGFNIPTLCHMDDLGKPGACRICVVEVEGARSLVPSCTTPVRDGMKIKTNTRRIIEARRMNFQLLMAGHEDCLSCPKNHNCELQEIGSKLEIDERLFYKNKERKIDDSAPAYYRNNEKCILCQRCVEVCDKIVGVSTLTFIGRGHDVRIGNAFDRPIMDSVCIECGQCVLHCPTAALVEKMDIDDIMKDINNPDKFVVVQTAPAVRAALGEGFDMEPGTLVTGKMVAALKRIGFDKILDTTFGADLTIMEEGFELLERIEKGENIPQFTSCCPAWVKFVEHFYPELIPNLSTSKSPHQMLGAIIKAFYSQKYGVDPKNIVTVSVMPCTAKKFERQRCEMNSYNGLMDVDYSITTRELIKMIKETNLDFVNLPDEQFDPLAEGTGAGDIFGASGGVMEAALRTAYEVKTGKRLDNIEFEQIRGVEGVKEGKIDLDGIEVRFLVISTPKNAIPFIEKVIKGESPYHFIEVMVCPGGCIGGGGQPLSMDKDIVKKRMQALYNSDRSKQIRRSYENPVIKKLYEEFLGKPLSELSEKYLHTSYTNRGKFREEEK